MSSTPKKPEILVIIGPTASGKSALAVKLAKKFSARGGSALGGNGAEIVSADSRQIYRGMDIGTAKPTRREMSAIPHHLIDIKNPDEDYTVVEYKKDALKAIRKILRKGKLPIVAGGTGLYVKAVVDNLYIPAVAADKKLRQKLESEAKKYGLGYLFKKLVKLDPEAVYIVDPKNPRRVIRALEIAIKTGKPFSAQRKSGKPLFNVLQIGINVTKNKLKKRINARVGEMIKNGLATEVRSLVKKYPSTSLGAGGLPRSFDAIGYREIIKYLRNEISLEEAADLVKKNTWRYAKRQMTWFKKDVGTNWPDNNEQIEKLVENFLNKSLT